MDGSQLSTQLFGLKDDNNNQRRRSDDRRRGDSTAVGASRVLNIQELSPDAVIETVAIIIL